MSTTRNSKRILSVTVTREVDTDPDTSWLGEYANQPTSEYSIDRAHAEDCRINDVQGQATIEATIDQLERVIGYLDDQRIVEADDRYAYDYQSDLYDSLSEAQDILIECQDKLREDQECDCDEHGDMSRGEYRYFNPSFNYVDKFGAALPETPDEVRQYVRQDYERMESLNRGLWSFLGIGARARVQVNGDVVQTVRSGSLWGVESDGDYDDIEREQLAELRDQLHALGF